MTSDLSGDDQSVFRSEWHRRLIRGCLSAWPENRVCGCRRFQGALASLGHEVSRCTIANILKQHGLDGTGTENDLENRDLPNVKLRVVDQAKKGNPKSEKRPNCASETSGERTAFIAAFWRRTGTTTTILLSEESSFWTLRRQVLVALSPVRHRPCGPKHEFV